MQVKIPDPAFAAFLARLDAQIASMKRPTPTPGLLRHRRTDKVAV